MFEKKNFVIVQTMSKLLAIFLLILLPLSWTTAAMAAYCKHETVLTEQNHIGHHNDRDHSLSTFPDPDSEDGTNKPHAHCSLSHACSFKFPMSGADIGYFSIPSQLPWLVDTLPLLSSLPDEPERPKWPVAA